MGNDYASYGSGQNNKYLNLMPDSTGFYKGDICQYLDKDYRMPYSYEFGSVAAAWSSNTPNTYVSTDASGRTPLEENRCATLKVNRMLFPASGYRAYGAGGSLYYVGYYGDYWSSSAYSAASGYRLRFTGSTVNPSDAVDRQYGIAVRCVLRE
jgi:hypothetical protein